MKLAQLYGKKYLIPLILLNFFFTINFLVFFLQAEGYLNLHGDIITHKNLALDMLHLWSVGHWSFEHPSGEIQYYPPILHLCFAFTFLLVGFLTGNLFTVQRGVLALADISQTIGVTASFIYVFIDMSLINSLRCVLTYLLSYRITARRDVSILAAFLVFFNPFSFLLLHTGFFPTILSEMLAVCFVFVVYLQNEDLHQQRIWRDVLLFVTMLSLALTHIVSVAILFILAPLFAILLPRLRVKLTVFLLLSGFIAFVGFWSYALPVMRTYWAPFINFPVPMKIQIDFLLQINYMGGLLLFSLSTMGVIILLRTRHPASQILIPWFLLHLSLPNILNLFSAILWSERFWFMAIVPLSTLAATTIGTYLNLIKSETIKNLTWCLFLIYLGCHTIIIAHALNLMWTYDWGEFLRLFPI